MNCFRKWKRKKERDSSWICQLLLCILLCIPVFDTFVEWKYAEQSRSCLACTTTNISHDIDFPQRDTIVKYPIYDNV